MSRSRTIPGMSLVENELAKVEDLLQAEARSDVRVVLRVAGHILGSGGKRFRPLLTLLSARMLGFKRKNELYAYAAAMEFAHTSTLLHDDVIDEADVRRGRRSANREWGNAASIIVGDYVLFKSFSLVIRGGNMEVIKLVADISVEMAEGEAYQLALKQRVDLSEPDYERIIKSKTALLIQGACQVPALAAGASRKKVNSLKRFGYHLGMAFQVVDDVLDYTATGKSWGKQLGKDFLEGKSTLPVILAYKNASSAQRKRIKELFEKKQRNRKEFEELLHIISSQNGIQKAMDRARDYVSKARKELDTFPDNPARKALGELAEYVVQRAE
ncbi:MAG: polyprenyl synthetase family protein [bacterium]